MHLTPKEIDKLMLLSLGAIAARRKEKGLKLNYPEAVAYISSAALEMKIRLNQRQRIAFGDIGVFFTDRRFNIIFEPGKHNFFAETLGMEPLPVVKVGLSDKIKPAVSGTSRSTQTPDIPKYINLESSGNILHRLLKYALGATAIAGIVIITQLDFFHTASDPNRDVNSSGVQPVIPAIQSSASGKITCNKVISPSQDYVDYDPVNDLKW